MADDHPTVLSTLDSIEFVESLSSSSVLSASELLARWSRPSRGNGHHGSTVMCTQPVLEDVLSIDAINALSPQTWFEQVGDAIAEKAGCGAVLQEKESEKVNDQAEESSIEVTTAPESLGKNTGT